MVMRRMLLILLLSLTAGRTADAGLHPAQTSPLEESESLVDVPLYFGAGIARLAITSELAFARQGANAMEAPPNETGGH